jgi:hypothetical protein
MQNPLPTIGSSGTFTFAAPFNTLVNNGERYTCQAIRSINDYIANNEDILTDVYLANNLSETDYQTDASNNIAIVSFQSDKAHWMYVPERFILSFPLTNGVSYRSSSIVIGLPSFPENRDFSNITTDLSNLIHDRLGVTPVVSKIYTSKPVMVTPERHDEITVSRNLEMSYNLTDYGKVKQLSDLVDRLSKEKKALEDYIKNL